MRYALIESCALVQVLQVPYIFPLGLGSPPSHTESLQPLPFLNEYLTLHISDLAYRPAYATLAVVPTSIVRVQPDAQLAPVTPSSGLPGLRRRGPVLGSPRPAGCLPESLGVFG
jgi:hypothetical protein